MIERIRFWLIPFAFLFVINTGHSQSPDSILIFTQEQYFQLILANHPVVRQASLLESEAQAYLQKARGSFDPKLIGDLNQKSFDGKEYFTVGEAGLKIPSWYGLEFKGAYNWSDGVFLNPENKLPASGQVELGLSVNLLQGLAIDERRAVLQQARIMGDLNEASRRAMANDLLLQANEVYWNWVFIHEVVKVYQEAVRLADVRLEGIVVSFEQGYKSAADTLESSIQLQNRQAELIQAQIALQNAALQLSNFLWTPEGVPLEASDLLRPPSLVEMSTDEVSTEALRPLVQTQLNEHPELLEYRFQLDQLEIDRRLKKEMLKPNLKVSYNFLGDGLKLNSYEREGRSDLQNLLLENYKWGVEFNFPLFLRKERGGLELADLKIQKTELKRQQKQLELQNKLQVYFNDINNFAGQIDLYRQMVTDYQRLLVAENDRFRLGSSSIFLINSREQKLIEAQLKLASLQTKYQKSRVAMQGAAGTLGD